MKNLSAMFVALSLAGATPFIPMGGGTAYAQTQAGEVTGIVYDSNGEPLIGGGCIGQRHKSWRGY